MTGDKRVPYRKEDIFLQAFQFSHDDVLVGILAHKYQNNPVRIVQWMAIQDDDLGIISFGLLRKQPLTIRKTVDTLYNNHFYSEAWSNGSWESGYWLQWESTEVPLLIGKNRIAQLFNL